MQPARRHFAGLPILIPVLITAACIGEEGPLEPTRDEAVLEVSTAATPGGGIRVARVLEPRETGFRAPVGLAYSPISDQLLVLESATGTPSAGVSGVARVPTRATTAWTAPIDGVSLDGKHLAVDPTRDRLLGYETASQELIEIRTGPDGVPGSRTVTRTDLGSLAIERVTGLAVDPYDGSLLLLDGEAARIIILEPDSRGEFSPRAFTVLDLSGEPLSTLQGLAIHPATGHLFSLELSRGNLREISREGRISATHDLGDIELLSPTGLTFAPSGDATDDPEELSLYVAEGRANGATASLSSFDGAGLIIELSFDGVALASVLATEPGTFIQSIDTWRFSPPSPDPAGIVFHGGSGQMLISDSEVNEMPIFTGVNVFATTLAGVLEQAYTTLPFSDEPTGIAYNPNNGHLFISDDVERAVFEADPGSDGRFLTGDDVITSISTTAFGSADPEGVTFDPAGGILYVVDGVNAEIYAISPGDNGVFDGVAPTGDDNVTSFDTQAHGLLDPEGLGYDSDFGHLYAVGEPISLVFHFTTGGALLRTIDISSAGPWKPAGLAYAPSSRTPGEMSLWIVDRGVDNNSDPSENDGRAYEVVPAPLPGNFLPTVTIQSPDGGAQYVTGDLIAFEGTATDVEDGNLTASLSWASNLDGDLGTGGSFSSDALSIGIHRSTARVTDSGGLVGSSSITILVQSDTPGEGPGIVDIRIATGTDDAEQRASGGMRLGSSDLELVYDGGDQLVGIRFQSVDVPHGAIITRAYVQFTSDEATSEATSLVIHGESTDDARTFSSTGGDISSRPLTSSSTSWDPAPWTTAGAAGPDQRTPDISPIIQEVVDRPAWFGGNSLVIIISGTGRRVAEAFEGVASAAALLHVEYTTSSANQLPTADFTWQATDLSVQFADASSDPDGTLAAWSWDFGDGATSTAQNPTHDFATAGTYTVSLTVTDDEGDTDSVQKSVTVSAVTVSAQTLTPDVVTIGATTTATLSGEGFLDGASVSFENGDLGPPPDVADVVVVSGSTIVFALTVKSGGPKRDRSWDLRVTNPDGTSAVLPAGLRIQP